MVETNKDAAITRLQLDELAKDLAQKRQELEGRVAELEQEIVAKDDCSLADAADAGSLQENRLRARGMAEQHRSIISEIDAAIRRIENASYGVSETTGEPIPYARLKLIPWARTEGDSSDR